MPPRLPPKLPRLPPRTLLHDLGRRFRTTSADASVRPPTALERRLHGLRTASERHQYGLRNRSARPAAIPR
ncbi:hypothetical protein BN2537_9713 [Streptomyces venezuelae]|nr:hypothetical protein BN2537_9713 [Streptomyces venezuelae]